MSSPRAAVPPAGSNTRRPRAPTDLSERAPWPGLSRDAPWCRRVLLLVTFPAAGSALAGAVARAVRATVSVAVTGTLAVAVALAVLFRVAVGKALALAVDLGAGLALHGPLAARLALGATLALAMAAVGLEG